MGVSLLCLAVLLFSPVLANLNEEKNGNTLEASLSNGAPIVHQKNTVQPLLMNNRLESSEIITEKNSTLIVANTQNWKKRPANKGRENRINQLNQKGRRPSGRNRRPPNEKKGYRKKTKQPSINAIRYLARSPRTDQLNKAVDDMLACVSQTLSIHNSTFSLRLNTFRQNMKISPWAFIALNKSDTNNTAEIVIDGKRRRSRAASDFKNKTPDITESYSGDDDEINLAEETILDLVTENSNDVDEYSTVPEEVTATEDDDIDDSTEIVTYISDNITQSKQYIATEHHRTQEPSPVVLSDGTVEYSLQLLDENGTESSGVGFSVEEFPEQQDDAGRKAKKLDGKRDRGVSRSYSRRPSAKVEGIGLIQRNGDVVVGMRQNSTAHIIETQLLIGPLQCVIDNKAGFMLQQSRVSMPQLTAKLRLTEVEGKLVEVRLKPTNIRPNEALITLRLSENGNLPSHSETARLVSYLSREMTRVWNNGYLLRPIRRQFKQLFVDGTVSKGKDSKQEDAQKLVQLLAATPFEEPPPVDTGKDIKEFSRS